MKKDSDIKNTFFYQAHCENGYPSSKRFYGGIGFTAYQVCLLVACCLAYIKGTGLDETLKDLLMADLYVSSALIGLTTIAGMVGGGKFNVSSAQVENKKEDKEDDEEL